MYNHFEKIKELYGDKAGVRLPNRVFRDLSSNIKSKNGSTNIQQSSFAYSYLVAVAFLYKYAIFIDFDLSTYIQNNDIKELLGYSKTTKSVDKVIKKGGILDSMLLTDTVKNYPLSFYMNEEEINGIKIREFEYIDDVKDGDLLKEIKQIVKNRNYEIKEPLFMTDGYGESDYGTLYSIECTHRVEIGEFLLFLKDGQLDNIDFALYNFFKSKCKGFDFNQRSIAIYKILLELGIERSTFYKHLNVLKEREYIKVNHKGWQMPTGNSEVKMEANDYIFLGVKRK